VHEIGRTGCTDEDQLRFAASERRVFVTRNRDDFIALTKRAYLTNEPHHGVLLVPRRVSNTDPAGIAEAVRRWAQRYAEHDPGVGFVDFP
jgi:hypothetical protein